MQTSTCPQKSAAFFLLFQKFISFGCYGMAALGFCFVEEIFDNDRLFVRQLQTAMCSGGLQYH